MGGGAAIAAHCVTDPAFLTGKGGLTDLSFSIGPTGKIGAGTREKQHIALRLGSWKGDCSICMGHHRRNGRSEKNTCRSRWAGGSSPRTSDLCCN
jgi:hypothetical protein